MVVAFAGMIPGLCAAEAWILRPFVTWTEQYDNNLRFSPNEEDSGWRHQLNVGSGFSRQTEDFQLTGVASLDFTRYSQVEPLFDDNLHGWDLRVTTIKEFELQEVGGDLLYRRDDTLVTRSVFSDPSDPGNTIGDDGDAGLTRRPIPRETFDIRPYWEVRLDERSNVRLRGAYLDVSYDDDPDVGIDLTDYKAYGFDGSYSYRLNEIDSVRVGAIYGHYNADEVDSKYDTYGADLGYLTRLTELWRLNLGGGWRRTKYETRTNDGSKSGYVANVDLRYDGERTDLSFRYDRRQLPSGSGNVSLGNQVRVRHTYDFTPRLSVTSEARWLKTKAIDSEQSGSDRKFRYFISGLTYRITPWWSLSGGYRYQWRVFDRDEGDSAESDMVFMSLSYNKALPLD
jgi:hypothetical protein